MIGSGTAQEPAGEPVEKPAAGSRSLRLLPLGEPPPYQEEVRDGVRFELEPEPGSVPPRQVVYGEAEKTVTLRLNLGRVTESLRIGEGTGAAVFRALAGAEEPPVPWLALQPPATGDLLALVWRDPGKLWTQPRCLILPDSAVAFPAGNVRIVNLLPVEAALLFGEDKVLLAPGKTLLRPVVVGEDLPFRIAYRDQAGALQSFYSGSVLLNRDERAQVVLFRADGLKPRRPAKAVVFNEAVPRAPVVPPAPAAVP